MATGHAGKEIAYIMNVKAVTIRNYKKRIRDKIGNFGMLDVPGIAIFLGIASIADITRRAAEWLIEE